jgi:hypothetical protein
MPTRTVKQRPTDAPLSFSPSLLFSLLLSLLLLTVFGQWREERVPVSLHLAVLHHLAAVRFWRPGQREIVEIEIVDGERWRELSAHRMM